MSARTGRRRAAGTPALQPTVQRGLQVPPATPALSRCEALSVGLLLVGALVLRLPHINDSLWFDEVWRTHVSLAGDSLRYVLWHDTHPPLFALVLWGWIRVFGDSEIAVRVPALLCGLGSIAMTVALARRWFGSRLAILAGGLLAASPAHIWYSHENKNNMLLVLLTVTAVWGLDRAWRSDRLRDWAVFVIASVLSLWTNLFAFWITCATCGWLCFRALRNGRRVHALQRTVTATLMVGAGFAPLAVWDLVRPERLRLENYLRPFTVAEVYKLLLIYLAHGNTLRTISPYEPFHSLLLQPPGLFLVDACFAGLLLSGLVWVCRRRHAVSAAADPAVPSLLLFYLFVPLVTVWLASWVNAQIYIERSMLIVLPPYVILLAAGLTALPRRAVRGVALITVLVLDGFALFNLWIAKADRWTVYKPKNDWRAAAQYFSAEMHDAVGPLMIFATAPASVLVYYDPRFAEVFAAEDAGRAGAKALIRYVNGQREPAVVEGMQRQHAETCYLIEDQYWENDFQDLLAAVKRDPKLQLVAEQSFRGLDVFKFIFRWNERSGGGN
jgi:uncharacterized membrane protein